MGESNANWVTDSEDLTAPTWLRHGSTTVKKVAGSSWNGIAMNEVTNIDPNDPLSPLVLHPIQYGSALAGKYLTLICYAQQVDETIQGLGFVLDNTNLYQFFPLKQGAYPKLIVSVIQVPGTFVGDHCSVGLWGVPTTAKGSFRVGAVRVMISSSEPDQLTFGEYIRTTGATLTRASGAGIGLPLHLVGLSGYLPANSRPQLPLLNRTQIVGLASGSGSSAERALLQDVDVGYQYFDTTLGLPLWWKGNSWITGDGTAIP
jgi:hypothetical protein